MVMLYIGGKKIEELADALRRLADPSAGRERIELRDESGNVVRQWSPSAPGGAQVEGADDPDWVKAITPEEIERRRNEPGYTFEELKRQLGWQ